MTEGTETRTGWLSPEGLESVRGEMPIVYVDAIPVRLDQRGEVTRVGLLLRVAADGTISRTVISGRVLYRERIRDALIRNLEKDLGPVALPRLPPSPAPFTVVEYFPDRSVLNLGEIIQDEITASIGTMPLPTQPGLGITFDQKALDRVAVDRWS